MFLEKVEFLEPSNMSSVEESMIDVMLLAEDRRRTGWRGVQVW